MKADEKYLTITDENFAREVLQSPLPVVVDFWADWCGPCHIMSRVIEEVAVEFSGQVKVGKLNVDDNRISSDRYGIRSIPTLLFFRDSQIVAVVKGAVPKKEIVEKLTGLLEKQDSEIGQQDA